MDTHSYIGCAVTVILREGSYHGTIHCFDSVDKRITLKDVSNPVNGNKYPGIRHFYACEILDMVMDDDYDESLMDSPPCAVIQRGDTPAYEDASPVTSKASYDPSPIIHRVSQSPPAKSCDRFTIIDEFNGQFEHIMSLIQDQMMIGFHVVSVGEGRNGKICWIAISVEDHSYFFDFLALGKNLFKKGLRDVLESKKITKIIHDCRFMSDLLFHKYSVNLANVFDTQVADAFAHRAWYGGVGNKNVWPKFVQPLSVCLFSHLKLSMEEIAGLSAREGKTKVEQELWPQRPLSVPLAETLACSVKYLDELRRLLLEKMMVEYMAGVDIYLDTVRNLPDSEVSWCAGKSEFLPKSFNNMNRFTQDIKDGLKNRERASAPEFSPFEHNRERREIVQQMPVSCEMDKNSRSGSPFEPASPVAYSENTERSESPSKREEKLVVKEKFEESAFSNEERITSVPSSLTLTSENKSSLGTSPTNNDEASEEDIFIQAARKMISGDISSDLMDLLKMPSKSPSVVFDPNPKTLNNSATSAQFNSCSPSQQTGVDWARFRKDSSNRTKLNILPAGCYRPLTKKNSKPSSHSIPSDNNHSFPQRSQFKSCQQRNNENKPPIQKTPSGATPQNSDPDSQITDTFFEIPDSDSFTRDYNVLGQTQTYSVSRQPFQYTANCNKSYSYSDNGTNNNNSSTNSPSPSPIRTEAKSPDLSSAKAAHFIKASSPEIPSRTEPEPSSPSPPVIPAEVQVEENGASRNYWVNSSGIMGNDGITHIERLMAVWRNNCK